MGLFQRTSSGYATVLDTSIVVRIHTWMSAVAETLEAGMPQDQDPLAVMLGMSATDLPDPEPVLRRVLPTASADPEQAAEFRRYTEPALRQQKIGHLQVAMATLVAPGEVVGPQWAQQMLTAEMPRRIDLDEAAAQAWIAALADVRLVLAERLNIHTSADAETVDRRLSTDLDLDDDTQLEWYCDAEDYELCSALQHELVDVMLSELPTGPIPNAPGHH